MESEEVIATANAVEALANTASKALEISKKLGGFSNQVFGDLVIDSFGLLSDKLKFYRIEKALLLSDKLNENLKKRGINSTTAIPPKVGIPLIETATLEEEEDLHSRWANMLTNAMDPNYKGKISRSYVSIFADFEAIDVLVLDTICKDYHALPDGLKSQTLFDSNKIAQILKMNKVHLEILLRNLIRLGCVKPGVLTSNGVNIGGHGVSSYKDIEIIGITELGLDLYKATN